MNEQRIWAPWRLGYVSGDSTTKSADVEPIAMIDGADPNCFLCRASAKYDDQERADRNNLVVLRTQRMIVVLNRYPYTNGHLLVSPLRHVGGISDLTDDESLESVRLLDEYSNKLAALVSAAGFNIGLNLGEAAGAGVPGHLHWHLVPRWPGDNNFMPTTAGIRVISQSLESLWETLTGCEA